MRRRAIPLSLAVLVVALLTIPGIALAKSARRPKALRPLSSSSSDVRGVQPAPTFSPNVEKNWPASFFEVDSISRLPSWAILPPTSALAV